jgi:hypothetical protein
MLYELSLFGSVNGQQAINRWNYLSSGSSTLTQGSFALLKALDFILVAGVPPAGGLLDMLQNALSPALTWTSVICRAPLDYAPSDFYEAVYSPAIAGQATGTPLSPNDAFGLRTNIVRTDIRRGTKRLAGVTEDQFDSGGEVSAGAEAGLATICAKMSETLVWTDAGGSYTFIPCVVSKEKYTTPEGNQAYRYYDTLAEQLDHIAQGVVWQFHSTKRTQNSRQYGHGA